MAPRPAASRPALRLPGCGDRPVASPVGRALRIGLLVGLGLAGPRAAAASDPAPGDAPATDGAVAEDGAEDPPVEDPPAEDPPGGEDAAVAPPEEPPRPEVRRLHRRFTDVVILDRGTGPRRPLARWARRGAARVARSDDPARRSVELEVFRRRVLTPSLDGADPEDHSPAPAVYDVTWRWTDRPTPLAPPAVPPSPDGTPAPLPSDPGVPDRVEGPAWRAELGPIDLFTDEPGWAAFAAGITVPLQEVSLVLPTEGPPWMGVVGLDAAGLLPPLAIALLEDLGTILSTLALPLPDRSVADGGSWTATRTRSAGWLDGGLVERVEATLVGARRDLAVVDVALSATPADPEAAAAAGLTALDHRGRGRVWLDLARGGLPVAADYTTELSFTGVWQDEAGEDHTVQTDSTLGVQVVSDPPPRGTTPSP